MGCVKFLSLICLNTDYCQIKGPHQGHAALGIPGFHRLRGLYVWRCQVVLRLGDVPLPIARFCPVHLRIAHCSVHFQITHWEIAQTGSLCCKTLTSLVSSAILTTHDKNFTYLNTFANYPGFNSGCV